MNKDIDKKSNIDIIKTFFNNNLVLLTGILIIVSSLISRGLSLILSVIQIASPNYSKSSDSNLADTSIGNILIGVIFLLLYIFSKRDNDNIKVPLKIYAIYTYVQLVLSVVVCSVLIIMTPFIIISVDFGGPSILTILSAIIILPAIILFLVMSAYVERKYAKSIYESATSDILCKEGAKEHSVFCFISAGVSFALFIIFGVVWTSFVDNALFVTFLSASVGAISALLCGIIAKKYYEYIPDDKVDIVTEETYNELTFPDINSDTCETSDPKYTREIEFNTNYKENFYE